MFSGSWRPLESESVARQGTFARPAGYAGTLLLLLTVSLGAQIPTQTPAQTPLQKAVADVAATANASVAVACALPNSQFNCDFRADAKPPMQSVFKLPLAVLMLHLVEQGKFTLDQAIYFLPSDRIMPPPFSPLQTAHPEGNVDVPLRELIRLSAAESDNTATDILLRLAGGPPALQTYIRSLGVQEFQVVDGEAGLHADQHAQFNNWFSPRSAVQFLELLENKSPLNAADTALLFQILESSPSTRKRIGAGVPKEAVVRHKSGSSDTVIGVTYALNDIALVTLPNGQSLALAVFITNSTDKPEVCEALIAQIAKTVYEAATKPGAASGQAE